MKTRIKQLILALTATGMVLGFGSVAFAKGPGHGHGGKGAHMMKKLEGMSEQERLDFLEDKLDRRVERMTEHLELTAEQQTRVRQVFADAQTQMLEIYDANKANQNDPAVRAEMKSVMKQARQDVGDILTDEQKTKLEQHKHKRRGDRKEKMLNRLDAKLDLSADQKAAISKILDEAHAELKAKRGASDSPDNMRGAHKQVFQQANAKINAVLNAEQQVEFAKIQETMKQHRGKRARKGKRGGF